MRALPLLLITVLAACSSGPDQPAPRPVVDPHPVERAEDVMLVIHGGAGTIDRGSMSPEREAEYRATLQRALLEGHGVLSAGGSSTDAVIATIRVMEDSPLFNAGRGAVMTHEGTHQLDASLMVGSADGTGVASGAVAGVSNTRHPIELARAVMERTPHVLLSGEGADEFSREVGLEQVPNSFFTTERRQRALQRALDREASETSALEPAPTPYLGTVGCVARDKEGRIAAGTSTGGMTNKRWGRIGDSPLVGAGTWADDRTLGVSCTGWGEFFIRGAVAHDLHARMRYAGSDVVQASRRTLAELGERGGTGGWVSLSPEGTAASAFNTSGMYRGWIDARGRTTVRIWRPE